MANSKPVWHDIFRYVKLKPDNITIEADTYMDTLSIVRGPGVSWGSNVATDTFEINVDYDISIPLASTKLSLEDVNGNLSEVTFKAGKGMAIVRNSAQELQFESYSVTETDTLHTVTSRGKITTNKIYVNNLEVGKVKSDFTEDGFTSYDPGHDLIGDGTLDSPLKFSPEYKTTINANGPDQFEFAVLGPGTLQYAANYKFDSTAATGSVTLERQDPSTLIWETLDTVSGITSGIAFYIDGTYSELYSGAVSYRLTYSWTGNAGTLTWYVQNTFEGGAYTPITSPQLKTDTDAKTVDINDLQFFQNNIRTTVSNTDIFLDPAGAGKVVALSNVTAPTFTGDLTGNVTGDITGNLISTNTSLTVVDTSAATAVFTGNLTGNADTVTNGVYTSGSYADPSWITSLDGTKVINAVLTTGSYADPSWITSLDASKIIGSISLSDITLDGTIRIYDNVIETVISNANLELRANGTGVVYIPDQLKTTGDFSITKDTPTITMGDNSLPVSESKIHMGNNLFGIAATISAGLGATQYNGATNLYLLNNTGAQHFDLKSYAFPGGWGPTGFGIRLRIEGSNGDIQIFNTTASTSKSTGALQVSGGVGVAGAIYSSSINASNGVLTSLVVDGTIRLTNNVIESIVSNSNLELRANGTGVVYISDGLTVTGTATLSSGTIDNMTIGDTTRAAGKFTTLAANNTVTLNNISIAASTGTITTSSGALTLNSASGGITVSTSIDMGANNITSSYTPSASTDLVNKSYVDSRTNRINAGTFYGWSR